MVNGQLILPGRITSYNVCYTKLLRVREVFASYNVRKVITQCPHCFNTFRNEYPQFGVNVEVIHHSVFLKDLIARGKIVPAKSTDRLVAFHDSCS